jgi:hypothetical protein
MGIRYGIRCDGRRRANARWCGKQSYASRTSMLMWKPCRNGPAQRRITQQAIGQWSRTTLRVHVRCSTRRAKATGRTLHFLLARPDGRHGRGSAGCRASWHRDAALHTSARALRAIVPQPPRKRSEPLCGSLVNPAVNYTDANCLEAEVDLGSRQKIWRPLRRAPAFFLGLDVSYPQTSIETFFMLGCGGHC